MDLDSSSINRRILELKQIAVRFFGQEDWIDIGLMTNSVDLIQNHGRLLRSLSFGDEDYGGHAGNMLSAIVRQNDGNLTILEDYVFGKYESVGNDVSSHSRRGRRVVFKPDVFELPDQDVDPKLVAVMMPFSPSFSPVFDSIELGANSAGMIVSKADDIWVHSAVIQDIFSLIYRSFIVVCDFTGKNPNVFYEAGIAHTLGKHVIPITQNADDIPFDLRHHRYLHYLNNSEGRDRLAEDVRKRITTLIYGSTSGGAR